MESKYFDSIGQVGHLAAGAVIKYGSLILGVYSVCKDEKDFALATLGGLGYLVGESLQRRGEQFRNAENLSKLEEVLKVEEVLKE